MQHWGICPTGKSLDVSFDAAWSPGRYSRQLLLRRSIWNLQLLKSLPCSANKNSWQYFSCDKKALRWFVQRALLKVRLLAGECYRPVGLAIVLLPTVSAMSFAYKFTQVSNACKIKKNSVVVIAIAAPMLISLVFILSKCNIHGSCTTVYSTKGHAGARSAKFLRRTEHTVCRAVTANEGISPTVQIMTQFPSTCIPLSHI